MNDAVRAQIHGRPIPKGLKALCDHDYQRDGYVGMCVIYVCTKCGDEYEKDVS